MRNERVEGLEGGTRRESGGKEPKTKTQGRERTAGTHVDLDVEIPQIGSELPDLNADDGDKGEERVLVGSNSDLETLISGPGTLISQYIHR